MGLWCERHGLIHPVSSLIRAGTPTEDKLVLWPHLGTMPSLPTYCQFLSQAGIYGYAVSNTVSVTAENGIIGMWMLGPN